MLIKKLSQNFSVLGSYHIYKIYKGSGMGVMNKKNNILILCNFYWSFVVNRCQSCCSWPQLWITKWIAESGRRLSLTQTNLKPIFFQMKLYLTSTFLLLQTLTKQIWPTIEFFSNMGENPLFKVSAKFSFDFLGIN